MPWQMVPDFVEKFHVKPRQAQMGPPGIPEQNRRRKDTSTARYQRKKATVPPVPLPLSFLLSWLEI
jgi:hypothetical protein